MSLFMYWYWLISSLIDLLPWITFFQVGMLVDCIANRSLEKPAKFGWIVFILLAHGVGAFFYFLFGSSSTLAFIMSALPRLMRALGTFMAFLQRYYQLLRLYHKRRQTQPKAADEPIGRYEQGYQVQSMPMQPVEEREPIYFLPDEQPQTSYPQLPQQQDTFN